MAGFDVGLIAGGNDRLVANTAGSREERGAAGFGLALGAVTGYVIGEHEHTSPGDAAVVNSGALWGGVAGHLLGGSYLAPNATIGGLGLAGIAMGTTGGVLLTRYYAASRKHAALIDAAGIAGTITGIATASIVFNQAATTTSASDTRVKQERTADFPRRARGRPITERRCFTRMIDPAKSRCRCRSTRPDQRRQERDDLRRRRRVVTRAPATAS